MIAQRKKEKQYTILTLFGKPGITKKSCTGTGKIQVYGYSKGRAATINFS